MVFLTMNNMNMHFILRNKRFFVESKCIFVVDGNFLSGSEDGGK